MDIEKLAAAMGPVIRAQVAKATDPLLSRIAELESRPMPESIKGDKGDKGDDGASVSVEDVERIVKSKSGEWALDFERRAHGVLERAVDRLPKPSDGKDGTNGKDGVGFDDLSVEHDGERGFTLKFSRGDEVREFPFTLPVVIDRGVHKTSEEYGRGDAVTFGGSLWIAQKDAPTDKPGQGDGWRLAVKKGRDAR